MTTIRDDIKTGMEILEAAVQANFARGGFRDAGALSFADLRQKFAADFVVSVAAHTVGLTGDGSATTALLATALFREMSSALAKGADPEGLKNGIDRGVAAIGEALKRSARAVPTSGDAAGTVATILKSSAELAEVTASGVEMAGAKGSLLVRPPLGARAKFETMPGCKIDEGYLSCYFITNVDDVTAELEAPSILVASGKLASITPLAALLPKVAEANRSLLLIGEELEPDILAELVAHKLAGTVPLCAIQAPFLFRLHKERLEDLAVLTGGRLVDAAKLTGLKLADLGKATLAVVGRFETVLVGTQGGSKLAAHLTALRKTKLASAYDRERLQERMAMLEGDVSLLSAARPVANQPDETALLKDLVTGTRAAMAEGIVAGGGVALACAPTELAKLQLGGAERAGVDALAKAVAAPFLQIARRAGADPARSLARARADGGSFGFDVVTGEYTNMFDATIVDLTMALRLALENASAAAQYLLLESKVHAQFKARAAQQTARA
jgi:chaperonin GroEL